MVYGVFDGEYSDWDVKGYFENESDAKEYCKRHSGYVLPLVNLKTGDPEIRRAYIYSTLQMKYREAIVIDRYSSAYVPPKVIRRGRRKDGGEDVYEVIVYVRPCDEHKIPKIAYDAIAKWKAEQEGIT